MQLGTGSGATSPDPADFPAAAFEQWCWNNNHDPDDDGAIEAFVEEMSWVDGEDVR